MFPLDPPEDVRAAAHTILGYVHDAAMQSSMPHVADLCYAMFFADNGPEALAADEHPAWGFWFLRAWAGILGDEDDEEGVHELCSVRVLILDALRRDKPSDAQFKRFQKLVGDVRLAYPTNYTGSYSEWLAEMEHDTTDWIDAGHSFDEFLV